MAFFFFPYSSSCKKDYSNIWNVCESSAIYSVSWFWLPDQAKWEFMCFCLIIILTSSNRTFVLNLNSLILLYDIIGPLNINRYRRVSYMPPKCQLLEHSHRQIEIIQFSSSALWNHPTEVPQIFTSSSQNFVSSHFLFSFSFTSVEEMPSLFLRHPERPGLDSMTYFTSPKYFLTFLFFFFF